MCSILIFLLKYFQKCIDPGFLDFGLGYPSDSEYAILFASSFNCICTYFIKGIELLLSIKKAVTPNKCILVQRSHYRNVKFKSCVCLIQKRLGIEHV